MKSSSVTFRADRRRRIFSYACLALSASGAAAGFVMEMPNLVTSAAFVFTAAAASLLACDAIVVDGRRHVIARRRGVWPALQESSRPFSEVDHVSVERMPTMEVDGFECTQSRLSIVRKFGAPIVLARSFDQHTSLQTDAERLSVLLGVETRITVADIRRQVSVL